MAEPLRVPARAGRRPALLRWLWAGLCAGALLAAQPVVASAPGGAVASVPLHTDSAAEGLFRVHLPLEVLQHLRRSDGQDLRVVNAAGQAVPHAWAGTPAAPPLQTVVLPHFIWPEADGAAEQTLSSGIEIELRADGTVLRVHPGSASKARAAGVPAPPPAGAAARAWLLDVSAWAPAGPQPSPPALQALNLQWPLRGAPGLQLGAQVWASRDARQWRSIGQGTLFELHEPGRADALLQQRVVLQPLQAGERYLRLNLSEPLPLQAVQAERQAPASDKPLDSVRLQATRSGPRAWVLDAGAWLPVQRLQVHLAEDNSLLPLSVEAGSTAPQGPGTAAPAWLTVGQHTAYRLLRSGRLAESGAFEIHGAAARAWRFTLDERVPMPERGFEVTLWWPARQIVFAARGPAPFALELGQAATAQPALEPQVLMPGHAEGDEFRLPLARTGVVELRPVAPAGWLQRWSDAGPQAHGRWLLWALLGAAVALLAVLAWRLGRDLQRPESDGGSR